MEIIKCNTAARARENPQSESVIEYNRLEVGFAASLALVVDGASGLRSGYRLHLCMLFTCSLDELQEAGRELVAFGIGNKVARSFASSAVRFVPLVIENDVVDVQLTSCVPRGQVTALECTKVAHGLVVSCAGGLLQDFLGSARAQ